MTNDAQHIEKWPNDESKPKPDKLLSAKITALFWNFVLWNFFVIHGLPNADCYYGRCGQGRDTYCARPRSSK